MYSNMCFPTTQTCATTVVTVIECQKTHLCHTAVWHRAMWKTFPEKKNGRGKQYGKLRGKCLARIKGRCHRDYRWHSLQISAFWGARFTKSTVQMESFPLPCLYSRKNSLTATFARLNGVFFPLIRHKEFSHLALPSSRMYPSGAIYLAFLMLK